MRRLFSQIHKLTKAPYRKKLIFSLISAFVLVVCNYFVNNASLFTGESVKQYYCFQKICNAFHLKKPVTYEEAIYFNISYDKDLVPVYEGDFADSQSYKGTDIITDRGKLLKLLWLLKESDKYKYIILDLTFDDVIDKTQYDDSLFNQIKEMRHIVFIEVDDVQFSRNDLKSKQAKAFYYYTPIETNFARYQFTFDGEPSIATHVYDELNPNKTINKYGFDPLAIYTSDGKLCYNSLFLTFDENSIYNGIHSKNINNNSFDEITVFNLGQYFQENADDLQNSIIDDTEDKFVVICNTATDDIHDTYIGQPMPGAQIILRALSSLNQGKHYVSFLNLFYWFVIFSTICFCVILNKPLSDKIISFFSSKKIRRLKPRASVKFWSLGISLFSFSAILIVFSFFEYVIADRVTSICLPIAYFTIVKIYNQLKF